MIILHDIMNYCVSSNNDIVYAGMLSTSLYLLNSNHHYGIVMTVLYKNMEGQIWPWSSQKWARVQN